MRIKWSCRCASRVAGIKGALSWGLRGAVWGPLRWVSASTMLLGQLTVDGCSPIVSQVGTCLVHAVKVVWDKRSVNR